MKIKMTVKYKGTGLFITVATILLALFTVMTVLFVIKDGNYLCAILCLIPITAVVAAIYFRFNYGIRINEKRIVIVEQSHVKVFSYENVRSMTVSFTDKNIRASVQTSDKKEYIFVWDNILAGNRSLLPSQFGIKLNKQFVEKSISTLSTCPKVKPINFYKS